MANVTADRVAVGPVVERMTELRAVLTVKEISLATGLSLSHLFSLSRKNRQTVPAATAKALLAVDPEAVGLRVSDLPRFSGEAFKTARIRRGHSQGSLEVQAGVAIGTLYHWEHELVQPTVRTLRLVLGVLGCEFSEVSKEAIEEYEDFSVYLPPLRDAEISPYPCGVCGERFRSRIQLATHPHGKSEES